MSDPTPKLPSPPHYASIISRRFRIEPGLHPFPTDFGQGEADRRILQIDTDYGRYLRAKQAARRRHPRQVYLERAFTPPVQAGVCEFIVNQLALEHPNYFTIHHRNGGIELYNSLLARRVRFVTTEGGLALPQQGTDAVAFSSGLDALAMQLQEDLVVLSRAGDRHWVSAIHLCFPNNWSAQAKIGRGFSELHEPVPHFQRIAAMESRLVDAMIHRGPYVRFAWGLSFDEQLDHAPGTEPASAGFDPSNPQLFLRVERQCLVGLPALDCALFTIRTYYYDTKDLGSDPELVGRVRQAISSMSEPTLTYKGIGNERDAILNWLDTLQATATAD